MISPRSVVDVGCGVGVWLAACLRAKIDDILGIDGDYVPRERLLIPHDRFVVADLSRRPSLSIFDLAISLEVAEHLPETSAQGFVALLTRLAPVILFSAAVSLHNEQWQEYWRSKFSELDYVACDAIRPVIWGDESVLTYYQQNILVYVATTELDRYPRLASARAGRSVDLVHPFLYKVQAIGDPTLGRVARELPRMLKNSARHHLGRLAGRWTGRKSSSIRAIGWAHAADRPDRPAALFVGAVQIALGLSPFLTLGVLWGALHPAGLRREIRIGNIIFCYETDPA